MALSQNCWVILGKLINLSDPHFYIYQMGVIFIAYPLSNGEGHRSSGCRATQDKHSRYQPLPFYTVS